MPSTLGKYQLGKTLGSGVSCKVKLARNAANGNRYAIKILNEGKAYKELMRDEIEVLKKLHHDHIVNLVEVGNDLIQKQDRTKPDRLVDYIVLELAQGGELFDFVANTGRFKENVARAFFHQFMDALRYMHMAGICHRDLKPENIMLDANFNLKIADFGFAAPTLGRDKSGQLSTQLGTTSYMAPEIHLGKPYSGQSVDLFASAIILFIMLTQRPPFTSAEPSDGIYKLLAANRGDLFWKAHDDAESGPSIFSSEFKDLFENMTKLNPKHRYTMEQVLKHPWMQGQRATPTEIKKEFVARKIQNDAQILKQQEERRTQRAAKAATAGKKVRRGDGHAEDFIESSEEFKELAEDLEMDLFDETQMSKQTQFFSSSCGQYIFQDLTEYFKQSQITAFSVSDVKWKVKFELPQGINVTCSLYRVDSYTTCVDFTRVSGDQLSFFKAYQQIASFLSLHNDSVINF